MTDTSSVTIFHNPACGTSRNVLAMIRNAGIEPRIVHYLQAPPSREELASIAAAAGMPVRGLLRDKEPLCRELGLDHPDVGDERLLDAMVAHPVLINRPIVVAPQGTRLCRPADTVLALLPTR